MAARWVNKRLRQAATYVSDDKMYFHYSSKSKVIPVQAMKAVEVYLHSFINLALDVGE
jgi:hypothetical protein